MLTRRHFVSLATFSLLGAALSVGLPGCSSSAQKPEEERQDPGSTPAELVTFAFDTIIGIQASCDQALLSEVDQRLQYYESIFSRTVTGSDIYAINHADGMPTLVSPETADIISKALDYSELSDGLFDITIGSATQLWDFKNGIVPNPERLREAVSHIDYRTIQVDGQTVTLTDPLAQLDLGGIAKGYIADDIADFLRRNGCTSALINLGGNAYGLGSSPQGDPWDIGIQDPNQARGSTFAHVAARDLSVVTSAVNERSFERDGILYHHLLDPHTGMPSQNGTASATILSKLSLDGDALSTIAFLLGADEGISFVAGLEGIQATFMDTVGTTVSSEGLEVTSA